MIQLKTYQHRALDGLTSFLADARLRGAKEAYERLDKSGLRTVKPYQPIAGLEAVPYVCLRLQAVASTGISWRKIDIKRLQQNR